MEAPDHLIWRRALVLGAAIVYWLGVWAQARRVRRQIGRSANTRPRGAKERLLWGGWSAVILAWMLHPFVAGRAGLDWLVGSGFLWQWGGFILGTGLLVGGYAGTIWCYAAMGAAWRIGVNRKEKNALIMRGPYGHVRHPIYLFQMVMLLGAALLLPTLMALVVLGVHFMCAWVKASDEEAYLSGVHGSVYAGYIRRTGRFVPRWRGDAGCAP